MSYTLDDESIMTLGDNKKAFRCRSITHNGVAYIRLEDVVRMEQGVQYPLEQLAYVCSKYGN